MNFPEFELSFLEKDAFEKAKLEDAVALIVFPWDHYNEIFEYNNFKKFLEQRSVIVVGPSIHFFEVEKWVLDGSVAFLSSPVNSMQIESILSEIVKAQNEPFSELQQAV